MSEGEPRDATRCSRCGADLPTGALADLCPKCLIRLGLGSAAVTEQARAVLESDDRIGHYKLLERIGEGGMGVVYLAEQERPVRRRVALKLVKQGMDTKQVVARFESERQALAMMAHPNIARVYDAGATERGRPYFVMEHVAGVPITEYCDTQRLDLTERLRLFIRVCEGVQHAHQKGIIHRDIKPTNVLVALEDGRPVPKIIDFGVAKATSQRLTELTMYTAVGQLIGTPEYMSPEQAEMSGLDVDTRSDVYSLGVLLYELLVGRLPFSTRDLRASSLDEMRRRIREEEAIRPSVRLSSLGESAPAAAARRRTDPVSLTRSLRGDLDWITVKALEKDRTRRYGSPAALAEEINHYLNDEPVSASPPGKFYLARKFVTRHRVGVAAGVVVSGALLLGLAAATIGLAFALRARGEARAEAETAAHVSDFLVDIFRDSSPERTRGATVTAQEILDRGAARIETELAGQPEVQARMQAVLGQVYFNLGLWDEAEKHVLTALDIHRELLGEEHHDTLASKVQLANLRTEQGRRAEAETLLRDVLARYEQIHGREHEETLDAMTHLAYVIQRRGRLDEAEAMFREVLEVSVRMLGEEHWGTLETMNALGFLLWNRTELEEAEMLFRRSLAGIEKNFGEDHPYATIVADNLAKTLVHQGRYSQAGSIFESNLETCLRVFGEEHPRTLTAMCNLGMSYLEQDRLAESEELLRETLTRMQRQYGPEHYETLTASHILGWNLVEQGRLAEAELLLRGTLEARRRTLGEDHIQTLRSMSHLARAIATRPAESEPMLRDCLARCRRTLGDRQIQTLKVMASLTDLLVDQGRLDEAEPLARSTLEGRREVFGERHPQTLHSGVALVRVLERQTRHAEAEPLLLELNELSRSDPELPSRRRREVLEAMVAFYESWGKSGRAAEIRSQLASEVG